MAQRNYYVVSPNVWNDGNFDHLVSEMKSRHIVLMGWQSDNPKGQMFSNIKGNDVILVAWRQKWQFNYYFLGIVNNDETLKHSSGAQCKTLSVFIDLGNIQSDILNGWSAAGSTQIPAIGRIDGNKNPDIITLIDNIINKQIQMEEYKTLLEKKKNIILQGAPGVGKTYTTAKLALAICDGIEKVPDNHDDVMKRYEQLQKEGRIGFVTFHQSMDYEDFVEGIKPSTDNGTITYDVEDGIFKQISIKAQAGNNFDEIYDKFISEINDYDEENVFKIPTPKGTIFGVTVNTKNNLSLYVGSELQKTATLTKENIRKMSEDDKSVKYYQPYFRGVVNILKSKGLKSQKNTDKNYVLIIDEINRGNVSKIFGELITLLEADKRIDGDHPIKVTLPYSKEEFGVPSNLYIIGTMNTTDRSVGNIDYAVRRRFAFVTLKSDKDVVKQKSIPQALKLFDAVETFIKKNQIEMDFEDLMVGHSYFIAENETELKIKWDYEIIPLLREYYKDGLLKQDITPEIAVGTWRAASLQNQSDVTQSSTPDPTPAASTQTT